MSRSSRVVNNPGYLQATTQSGIPPQAVEVVASFEFNPNCS